LSTWTKVSIGAGLAVAVGAVVLAMALGGNQAARAPVAQHETDGPGRTLAEAKGLLAQGDAQGAMERAERLPAESNLRSSADFKLIQSAWADDLFGKAQASGDAAEKRSLLDRIARAATLDPVRRKRAASELDTMQKAAVDVTDLPSEDGISIEAAASTAPPAPAATAPDADADAEPVPVAAASPKKPAGVAATKPAAPTTAKPSAPKAAKSPSGGATLVRQNPFDDP
jgi:hypothetical protein